MNKDEAHIGVRQCTQLEVRGYVIWQEEILSNTMLTHKVRCERWIRIFNECLVRVPAVVDFVELRLSEQSTAPSISFKPGIIIRKASFSIEISNTASAELLRGIEGLRHAE